MRWLSVFFNELIWYYKTDEKVLYLTFDDGPSENTGWIIGELQNFNAKATFFCLGEKVARYPGQYKKILEAGHSVGNHSYSHLRGWRSKNKNYYNDIQMAEQLVKSNLFRPPHGQIKFSQIQYLKQKFNIVMWDVMSKDYDQRQSPGKIVNRIKKKVRPGSVIVFHDSEKAYANLKGSLTEILNYFDQNGYVFRSIPFETTGNRTVKE